MLKHRLVWGALFAAFWLPLVACSGCSGGTGGTSGTGGAGTGGTTGTGGTHDAGALNDAGHDTSTGSCWAQSDCHNGASCVPPGQAVCGGACPTVSHPCTSDTDCASDAAVPQICVVQPCTCGPTNMGCLAGCTADSDCAEGESCGANHHCAPIACGSGQACPPDFTCGDAGTCARKSCTSDGQCSNACVEGTCYHAPGHCQFPVP